MKVRIKEIVAQVGPCLAKGFQLFAAKIDIHFRVHCQRPRLAVINRIDVDASLFEVINVFAIRRKLGPALTSRGRRQLPRHERIFR